MFKKWTARGLRSVRSDKIKVGDIIRLRKGEASPVDGILLCTSEEEGGAFVQTDQLDGEIDWKPRSAINSLHKAMYSNK